MIVVKLKGGLGNQLFQYAVGRHLAEINQSELKLDISFFKTYKLHSYSIGPFNIYENFASAKEIRTLMSGRQSELNRFISRLFHTSITIKPTYVIEKMLNFDQDILNLSDGVYLDGYWQSEKYFSKIDEIIRREFTIRNPPMGIDRKIIELMTSCEAVSIHIRRGSYLMPPYNQVHGICDLEYYQQCINLICKEVNDPHFFVFSDDPDWARNNLKLPHITTIIDHNSSETDFEDLRLMTYCKYHIIANSTFSWWGAWLCQRDKKTVFAPKKWYIKNGVNNDDLIPKDWQII